MIKQCFKQIQYQRNNAELSAPSVDRAFDNI